MNTGLSVLARETILKIRDAAPGSILDVHMPIGSDRTQAMILACAGARLPMIVISPAIKEFVVSRVFAIQRQLQIEEFVAPTYVRVVSTARLQMALPLDHSPWELPDRIIVMDPSFRGGAKWKDALTRYRETYPQIVVVSLKAAP